VHDSTLIETASRVAEALGLQTVANIQLKRDTDGVPALLEVNPRFPGAMPLTIASGVDMPSLTLDDVLGRPVPEHVDFHEVANVRYLEDVFLPRGEVLDAPAHTAVRSGPA
jgi:carbamoyl-phosphate synthase large subunit